MTKLGRPPVDDDDRKMVFPVRVSANEMEQFKRAAKGQPISRWMRETLLIQATKKGKPARKAKTLGSADDRLEALNRIVLDLNVRWQMFDELYSDFQNYAIFDRTGRNFWDKLWNILLEDLFLAVSRLLDQAETGPQDNFSLRAVLEFPEVAAFRDDLGNRLLEIEDIWKRGIRDWRHKRISHLDWPTVLGTKQLPTVPIIEVGELIEKMTDFVREIQHQLYHRDISYACSITGWVPQVLKYLKLGLETWDEKLEPKHMRVVKPSTP